MDYTIKENALDMDNIIKEMRRLYPVSDAAVARFKSILTKKEIPSKTIILWAGHYNRTVYFIERGITRSYCLVDGREMTTWFSAEGGFTCSSLSLYRGEAGFEYVETIEPTTAYCTTISQLKSLTGNDLELANWWCRFMEKSFLDMQDRHLARLFMNARQRYEMMLRQFPDICNRVNLGYIASYLGITQPSLSRIRAGRG